MDDERSLLDAAAGHLKAALAMLDDLDMPIAAARIDHALHEVFERIAVHHAVETPLARPRG